MVNDCKGLHIELRFQAGQFLGYDGSKSFFRAQQQKAQKHARENKPLSFFDHLFQLDEGPALHLVSSVSGAFFATSFCIPFDCVLNKYQNKEITGHKYSSLMHCARQCLRSDGVPGLFRGWTYLFVRAGEYWMMTWTKLV